MFGVRLSQKTDSPLIWKVKGKEVKRDEKFDVSLSEDGLTYTLKIKDMKGAVHRLIFSDVTDAHEGKYTFRAKGAESEAVPTIADPP
ncbi:Immunoglobulin superfamily member 22 [Dissostichus eleginoides]|nr:Immunoglobulin superfamily member 22 [Dissostichus eleginoides]